MKEGDLVKTPLGGYGIILSMKGVEIEVKMLKDSTNYQKGEIVILAKGCLTVCNPE